MIYHTDKLNIMKKLILVAAALATCFASFAKDDIDTIQVDRIYSKSHVGAYVGGGIHSFVASPRSGEFNQEEGHMAGLQYQYIFKNNFGFGIGAQISSFSSNASYQKARESSEVSIPGTTILEFTSYSPWVENQSMYLIEVPVQFLFESRLGNSKWNLQAGLGASFQFPLSGEFKSDGYDMTLTGYNPMTQKPMTGRKYTTTHVDGVEGDLSNLSDFGVGIQSDFGFRYDFCKAMGLYAGVYFDYGVKSLIETNDQVYAAYSPNDYYDVFNTNEVNKVTPMEMGVKVAMRFNFRNRKAERAAKEKIAADREEAARLVAEQAAREQAERDRLAQEEAARKKAEADRVAREAAERDRLAREAADKAKSDRYEKLRSTDRAAGFRLGNTRIDESDTTAIDINELKQCMEDYSDLKVEVTGHTDMTGSYDNNMKLGQKRAESYKEKLVENGVDAGRVECRSEGPNKPIADNGTSEGRRLNRRVSVELTK